MEKIFYLLVLTVLFFSSTALPESFSKTISPKTLELKEEKLTHLHFYFHGILTIGKNHTTIAITSPAFDSSTYFGTVFMADDPLNVGPDINSELVGRAQGLYASASQTEIGLLNVFNFVFTQGKYNGSTLTLLGHNAIHSEVREMPIVGGSKVFRFARGYALAKTHTFHTTVDNNSIVEYNVYVYHY